MATHVRISLSTRSSDARLPRENPNPPKNPVRPRMGPTGFLLSLALSGRSPRALSEGALRGRARALEARADRAGRVRTVLDEGRPVHPDQGRLGVPERREAARLRSRARVAHRGRGAALHVLRRERASTGA